VASRLQFNEAKRDMSRKTLVTIALATVLAGLAPHVDAGRPAKKVPRRWSQVEQNRAYEAHAQRAMKSRPNGFFKRVTTSWRLNPLSRVAKWNHVNQELVVRPFLGLFAVSAARIDTAWNGGAAVLGPLRFLTASGRRATKAWRAANPLGRVRVTLRNRIHERNQAMRRQIQKIARGTAESKLRDLAILVTKEARNTSDGRGVERLSQRLRGLDADMSNQLMDFVMAELLDPDNAAAAADAAVFPVEGTVSFEQTQVVGKDARVRLALQNNKQVTVDANVDIGLGGSMSPHRGRMAPHVSKVMETARVNKMRQVINGKATVALQTVDFHTVRATVALGASSALSSAVVVAAISDFFVAKGIP